MNKELITKFAGAIKTANTVLVIQPENPDGDSLSSALALEDIFSEMGKNVHMHCAVSIPSYLTHLPGWDRVTADMPNSFDLAILVDTSAASLIERTLELPEANKLKTSGANTFVLDHHSTEGDLNIPHTAIIDTDSVATGELIYKIAKHLGWTLTDNARNMLTSSIMYDSLGLMSEGTTASTIYTVAELVESGVSLPALDEKRRELMKRAPEITKYKGELLSRIQYAIDGKLAYIHIPWEEIESYSDKYNPSMLVIDEMRMTEGVQIAVAFKTYPDGKLTAKIRANHGYNYAAELAEKFGGGGHPYAAGFKVKPANLDTIVGEVIKYLSEIL